MIKDLLRKLLFWIMPELSLFSTLEKILKEPDRQNVNIKATKLIVIGNMANAQVQITPEIKPEIILSKFSLDAALQLAGRNISCSYNNFQSYDTAVKISRENDNG